MEKQGKEQSVVKKSISTAQVFESYLKPSEETELSYSDVVSQVS